MMGTERSKVTPAALVHNIPSKYLPTKSLGSIALGGCFLSSYLCGQQITLIGIGLPNEVSWIIDFILTTLMTALLTTHQPGSRRSCFLLSPLTSVTFLQGGRKYISQREYLSSSPLLLYSEVGGASERFTPQFQHPTPVFMLSFSK